VPIHATCAGITAAAGICAELGIPLTHRGLATGVRFLTGHSKEGGEEALAHSTAALVDPHTTLVVYMGLGTLPKLAGELAAAGLDAATPAAAIERGTTPEQRVVFAPLGALPGAVAAAALRSPTLIVVGAVVALAPGWAEGAGAAAGAGQHSVDAERVIFASHA
jgi:siroheme synthase